ncbi:AAA family ATPase [Kribbella sp. NPDC056951]|uniref:AAA family ATPase n=1 Tax=Kribbella sp. NPDC056951 TaxID=3345978 RepID=UPI003639168F
MAQIGDGTTRLVVVRGNSGSGKSSTAQEIRRRLGYGVAWVEQDYFRRTLLREHDKFGQPNVGLIDLTVRYALDHGYHVVLEGILNNPTYGDTLRRLIDDHAGVTGAYYFQLPFEETIRRHSTRELSKVVTAEQMRDWYRTVDLLGVPGEQVIGVDSTLEQTVDRILTDLDWTSGGAINEPIAH